MNFQFLSEKRVLYANSANPDQTPQTAASDLGLHRLPKPTFVDASH